MGLFHHHDEQASPDAAPDTFEVVGPDGRILRYQRDDVAEFFETSDAGEAQQQVALGWVILDERTEQDPDQGPSEMDLLPGIEGLRVGGMFGYERGESRTVYTLGFLKDGAVGTPEE